MSKRHVVRLISYFTAIIIILSAGMYLNHRTAEEYKRQLSYQYTRAMGELSAYLSVISADLQKSLYVGTPQKLALLSAKLWRESGTAKSALSALPAAQLELEEAYEFLSQVGDYAMSLTKTAAVDSVMSEADRANLRQLSGCAEELDTRLQLLSSRISGKMPLLTDSQPSQEEPPLPAPDASPQEITAFPSLIYDGPFSDHLLNKEPLLTRDAGEITPEQAKAKASGASGLDLIGLHQSSDESSAMPSYCFTGENTAVGVTKKGGFITYLLKSRQISDIRLSAKQAEQKAEQYLQTLGISHMEKTYYEVTDGICTFNYAAMQDQTILYTDLVKIGIALDNGEAVFYDARGYITNHTLRDLPSPAITAEQALSSLSKALTVGQSRLALIPTAGKNELLTYEFQCTGDNGQNILVYINALTGAEEQILLLVETERGVLTK